MKETLRYFFLSPTIPRGFVNSGPQPYPMPYRPSEVIFFDPERSVRSKTHTPVEVCCWRITPHGPTASEIQSAQNDYDPSYFSSKNKKKTCREKKTKMYSSIGRPRNLHCRCILCYNRGGLVMARRPVCEAGGTWGERPS